jgi:16S rRNA (cytosine1402-N4)-methyltransferase
MESLPFHDHIPVMPEAVMELLSCRAGGFYIDGTIGGAGYAEAILAASEPDGTLLGLDWDDEAIERAREKLRSYENRTILEKAGFSDLPHILQTLGSGPADGVVLDLGVSSFQLDDPVRGFSFLREGPLDMRMDRTLKQTAADLVNFLPEKELAFLIFQLGEERWARRIARAIVTRRRAELFSSTLGLAELIKVVVPGTRDSRRIHPATRTFQALRMAVNRELEQLKEFLSRALEVLKPGGRLCIVSFHSLEDRLVKEEFRNWSKSCRCDPGVVVCRCEGEPLARLLTKRPLRPHQEEVDRNARARSARLRAIEKRRAA